MGAEAVATQSTVSSVPPLPAPTETDVTTTSDLSGTDVVTDVSKPGDQKSSVSLPEDGTPITLRTGHRHQRSQTSLLIEYFEGGKSGTTASGDSRRPSVRVRLTPSSRHRKSSGSRERDHIQITETKSRKSSGSRRATRSPPPIITHGDRAEAMSAVSASRLDETDSYASATEESNVSRNPIDIEINRGSRSRRTRRPASPLIPTEDGIRMPSYEATTNMSDISAIPTDSFLDGSGPGQSRSPSNAYEAAGAAGSVGVAAAAAAVAAEKLQSKSRTRDRERDKVSVSRTREKDRDRDRSRHNRSSKSRATSISKDDKAVMHDARSSRSRRASRSQVGDSLVSAAESSVVSSMEPGHRPVEQQSIRSGTSKASSINNPKLLETVEDAIRRLILPELNALKREHSKHRDRMGSITSSATSDSRDGFAGDRRRTSGKENIMMPKDINARAKVERRDREARNDFDDTPTNSGLSQASMDEEAHLRSHERLMTAASGAGLGAAALAAHAHEAPQSPTEDKRTRRRRRAEMRGRNSDHSEGFDEGQDKSQLLEVPSSGPAMPLTSDVNASDVTRASIMSAESDRPHSASEELTPMHNNTSKDGVASGESMDSSPTPTNGPTLQSLGTQHANISHGDLRALPRQRMDELERENQAFDLFQMQPNEGQNYEEERYDDMDRNSPVFGEPGAYDYYRTTSQVVPPPLKYTPYQPERRGLSPIQSVSGMSGYTDNGSEAARDSRYNSQLSPEQSPTHQRSVHSPSSIPSNAIAHEFDEDDMRSPSSVGPDYGRSTMVSEGSEIDPITDGRTVRDVGANPAYVHPVAIESNVASLVESSMLTDSAVGSSANESQPYNVGRPPMPSVEEETPRSLGSPSKRSDAAGSPVSRFAEYDIDEYGRKVPRAGNEYHESPTTSELAITSAAVGAAAAVLRAQSQGRTNFPTIEDDVEMADAGFVEPAGVQRNKSFKERAQTGQRPGFDPKHSVDRLDDEYEDQHVQMGFSGMPDPNNPIPEIGPWNEDDLQTNPSMVDGEMENWRGDATPRDGAQTPRAEHQDSEVHRGADVADAVGAAAIATAAALAAAHSHNQQHGQDRPQHDDDYYRTSDDRKRDTLVTNPYEDSSPVVNLPGLEGKLMGTTGYADGAAFNHDISPYPSPSPLGHKVDEGYISQGPNKSPEQVNAKVGKGKGVDFNLQNMASPASAQDAYFTPKHARHLSIGQSHGMGSPQYDSSTGAGIDQIESKDIVALMQHLMVRDAQRSARDTEILVTLVRSAAEMRNNFEDMKRMLAETIAETEDVIINEVKDNTEKTVQRAINGPRPYPGSGARSIHAGTITGSSQAGTINGEDMLAQKKRNIFRRALKGLTAKGTNDLGRIEDMLNQLLSEVDVLKTQTAPGTAPLIGMVPPSTGNPDNRSLLDNLNQSEVLPSERSEDHGYEPEGQAGTSTTTASQSGHLSIQSKATSARQADRRIASGHRISTVPEATEEDQDELYQPDPGMPPMTPTAQSQQRAGSVPLVTPPPANATGSAHRHQGSLSTDNTPGSGSNGTKKKPWFASIPKISRWSETTTSSVAQVFRRSGQSRKTDEAESGGLDFHGGSSAPPSRAGSIGSYSDNFQYSNPNPDQVFPGDKSFAELSQPHHQGYDVVQAHTQDFQQSPGHMRQYHTRQMTPEDPKYKAHRNSLNLQHPQPKHGPTDRFRTALESQALLGYDSPRSNRSADWAGSVTSLNRFAQHNAHRESYGSASNEYQQQLQQQQQWGPASPTSAEMPPIPPKEPLDDRHGHHQMGDGRLAQESVESGHGTTTQLGGQNTSYVTSGADSSLANGGNSNAPGSPRQGQQLENRSLSAALSARGISRRPSGPRPMTPKSPLSVASAGSGGRASVSEERRKRDTFGSVRSQDTDTC